MAVALWTLAPHEVRLREVRLPEALDPGQVLVRTQWGAVSRGTEALVVAGLVPRSEHERMRGPHMGGSFEFPVKYGYSCVGTIEDAHDDSLVGRRVFCLHPHQTHFVVAAETLRFVPDGTPPSRAVLAPNVETAINVVWDAGISIGDRVCVVGAGVVGLLIAWVAARAGASVQVKDRVDRSAVCEGLGLQLYDQGRDFDVVIHASGDPSGLEDCLDLAGNEGLVVEASWHGAKQAHLSLGHAFHSRRLTIRSSQVGQIPPARRPRWDYARRMNLALDLCADPRLDCLFENPNLQLHAPDFLSSYTAALFPAAATTGLCFRIDYGLVAR